MKREVVIATKQGHILRAVLENFPEKDIGKKIINFSLAMGDEVVAMQIIEITK